MRDANQGTRTTMSLVEFDATHRTLQCLACDHVGLEHVHNPNNNSLRVTCPACQSKRPLGSLLHLKQTTRKVRKPAPCDLDDVWQENRDTCFICGAPKFWLIAQGIGRHAHHVLPYAQHGHQGPLVPVCLPCHELASARQRVFWFWYRRTHGDDISDSSVGVPRAGLPRDPGSPTTEAAEGAVEGLSDDYADD